MMSLVRKGARNLMPSLTGLGRWMGENQFALVLPRGLWGRTALRWPRSAVVASGTSGRRAGCYP